MEAGLAYNRRNASGGWSAVSAMAATNFRNNPNGSDGSALPPNLKINASHEHLLGHGWSAALQGEALLSVNAMPDSHKYSLGGPQNVRGFTSSSRRGDQGGVETLELRRALRLGQADVMLRGFVDAGAVLYHDPLPDGRGSDTLASAGAGAQVQLQGKYRMDLVWAKPIDGKDSGEGHNARVWMTLTASY
jgi:hemolysin activation/secretion protein